MLGGTENPIIEEDALEIGAADSLPFSGAIQQRECHITAAAKREMPRAAVPEALILVSFNDLATQLVMVPVLYYNRVVPRKSMSFPIPFGLKPVGITWPSFPSPHPEFR